MIKIRFTVKFLLMSSLLGTGMIFAQNQEQIIKEYINSSKGQFQRLDAGLKTFRIGNIDHSESLKGDVVGIEQTINGVPIFGSSANVLIRDGKVLSFADTFIKTYPNAIKGKESIQKEALVAQTIKKLNGLSMAKNIDGNEEPIKINTVYFVKGKELLLGYQFYIEEKETGNVWNTIISTEDGFILYQENITLSCNFHSDAYHHASDGSMAAMFPRFQENIKQETNFVLAPDNASYNVFALPVEAPTFGGRTLLTNPWDLTASSEGWHSDGTNHYTNTRGNNVYAYTDENNTNIPQFSPDGGAGRNFDFPLDITLPPQNYTSAAVTNLFYMNNKIHDVFYKFGFTESAKNFQTNNFGKGGSGNDAVLAESRDGRGYNNANFATPNDGFAPRMQMYLYEPKNMQNLFYNSPAVFTSRTPTTKTAQFGPALTVTGITANIAVTTPIDGCTAIAEDLTGKIALIQRGGASGCGFALKVKNAQLKGAVGAIIYDAPTSTPLAGQMGGTDSTITIPSVEIINSEGVAIVNQLASTPVNGTLKYDKPNYIYKDGSLDNGIVTHEYGHGISSRLTGTSVGCLNYTTDNEQMGEGWSDFFALMLTNRPGDNASVPRGMGTFAEGQSIDGDGIRPKKYSPNFAINDYTYGKTNGMKYNDTESSGTQITRADSHRIGFVWATMLWDLHWNYVDKYGYNSNVLADPNSGSARVLQLVMDALKLQPCSPSFIQGRDAILAAEMAKTNGVDKCMIWKTFAKRGLGVNASPGGLIGRWVGFDQPAPDLNDQVEDTTVPAECGVLAVNEATSNSKVISIYPNPVRNEFTIKTPSGMNLSGITTVSIYDFTGKLISSENINLNKQTTINASRLINGAYVVKISGSSINYSQKIIVSK
ncbi:T9SS C-terminal target domain-containing protein [Chryseobacterium sp. G0186]|uniref:T9SS-dependent M36 family metallopeptidase n=1 Tax=Chryseobacterium sp. G0186 TaxID=2487064 RepID=UPI000F50AE9A|nr:T9SS-dependent M36 family metallopeptidase [Chryseobacterium sp. G0186]AZA78314.1 T9SS C-terminal target domain-containing protein [Chryseobacterium sp. G0186]